jgi:single-strand DNA-binding protein
MAYEISGTVKVILDPQTFSSGFSKREFVITTADKFPQDIKLECLKDKAAQLDGIAVGQSVKVQFDISGREYNGRYFVNLTAWRVEPAEGESAPAKPKSGRKSDEPIPEDTTDYGDEDAPF